MFRQVKKKKYSPKKMKMPGDRGRPPVPKPRSGRPPVPKPRSGRPPVPKPRSGRPPVPKPRSGRSMVSRSEKEILRQLFTCVGENDIDCVREALKKGFDVKQEIDVSLDTLLNYCSYSGSVEMTKLLLEYDFDINHRNSLGMTPLLSSIISKKHDIAKLFIESGADVNIPDKEGNSPLIIAVVNIDTDLINMLVDHGANINHQNINGDTAVSFFAAKEDPRLTIDYLISKGGDINHQNRFGNTPLIISIMDDNFKTIEYLIYHGADVNIQNSEGNTAFIISIIHSDDKTTKQLFYMGADINIKNFEGDTALTIAANLENDNLVKFLLDNGGDVNTISDSKYYKMYIDMDSDYYAFCKKFASPRFELNRKTIRRKRRKIITEIKSELPIDGDLDNLEQINDFFEKLTPEYSLNILKKIDNEFFNGKTFPMFIKNGCCVIFCLEKCINLGAAGECYMDRSKTIKIVIDKNVFIEFFQTKGYIRDDLEPCEGLLECFLQTLEHEFLHGIIDCGCFSYGYSSIMPQGIEPVEGLEHSDEDGHSKIFMRILYNRFGQKTFYHGL